MARVLSAMNRVVAMAQQGHLPSWHHVYLLVYRLAESYRSRTWDDPPEWRSGARDHVMGRLHTFCAEQSEFKHWARRVIGNYLKDRWRAHRRRQELECLESDVHPRGEQPFAISDLPGMRDTIAHTISHVATRQVIERALNEKALTPSRAAVALGRLYGAEPEINARILGLTPEAERQAFCRATKDLKSFGEHSLAREGSRTGRGRVGTHGLRPQPDAHSADTLTV